MSMRLVAPFLVVALAAGACTSDPEPAPEPQASASPEPEPVPISPLTGLELPDGLPENPVYVVKIENTAAGAPQYGLDQADLVVEELVEGGLTRLAAFFHTALPEKVGHVRSVRGTDIGIAAPVGGQIVASGGAGGTLSKVEKAGIDILSQDAGDPGFSRETTLPAPYNVVVDLTSVEPVGDVEEDPRPYLTWTPAEGEGADPAAPAPTPTEASTASVRFSPFTTTTWELQDEKWVRTNGHTGDDFQADTMITMFARVGDAGYTDPAGNPVPETELEGEGRAVVLTADGALETTWSKDGEDATISFEAEDGTPVTIDPGKVWIELVPEGDGAIDVG